MAQLLNDDSIIDDSEMTEEKLSSPEIRTFGLRRQLYFNPGIAL
jgi:hypothetical protein